MLRFYPKRIAASLAITALTLTTGLISTVAMASDTSQKPMYNVQSTQSEINTFTRLGGSDRYETAIQIADHGWQSAGTAVLAPSGDLNMVDALASSSLAKALDGPILLADKDSVPQSTMTELKKLGITKVYIVSGTAVISANVESELTAAGIQSIRLGGSDRYETAINIAKEIQKIKPFQEVVVTNSYANVDAISIAPIAAAKGIPVLLVDKDNVPEAVSRFIKASGINKTYVIGGAAVVSDSVKDALPNATRLGGKDRFDTNKDVLKQFENLIAGGSIFFANGEDTSLIDSLTGAPMAAKYNGAIVLSNKESIPVGTQEFIQTDMALKNPVILGGTAVIADSVVESLGYVQTDESEVQTGAVELNVPNATVKDKTVNGNIIINADGETLQSVTVNGTIFVDPGKDGSTTLDNVQADRIVILSGADHSIHLKGTQSRSLVVSSSSDVRVVAEPGTTIGSTLVQSNATLESQNGANVGPLSVESRLAESVNVQLQGAFSNAVSLSGSVKLTAAAGVVIPNLIVSGAATFDSIQLAGQFSTVTITDNSAMTLVSGKINKLDTKESSNIVVKSGAEIISLNSSTGDTKVSGGGSVNGQLTTDIPSVPGTTPSGGGGTVVGGGGGGSAVVTVVKTNLSQAVSAANTNKATTDVSVDGSDVLATDKWVTAEVMTAYSEAIATAQAIVDKADATQTEVDNSVKALGTATTAFNNAKQVGTKAVTVVKTALTEAISVANTNKGTTGVSVDGSDVLATGKWVSEEVMTAYSEAIAIAQAVVDKADVTQAKVDNAVTALGTATTAFNNAKQAGTKVETDVKKALTEAVSAANTNKATVVVSIDGSDVLSTDKWVSAEVMTAYSYAIATAQAVVDKTDATQAEVDNAVTALGTATRAFNNAKQDGTKVEAVVINALTEAISAANTNKATTGVSIDGSDVLSTDKWVSAEVMTAYSDAIATAQAVVDKIDATQSEVDNAVTALEIATTTFNNSKQDGSKVVAITLNSIAITTPASKLAYKVGDALDITGLIVIGNYSNGSTREEVITGANITGFDSSAVAESQTLVVSVNGKTTTYTISVAKADGPDLTGVTIDDTANTISGLTAAMEFSTDGTNWIAYNETEPNLPNLTGTLTLLVRIAETATHEAGVATIFNFTVPTGQIPTPLNITYVSTSQIDVIFDQPVTSDSTYGLQVFDGDTYLSSEATYEGNVVHLMFSTPLTIGAYYSVWLGGQFIGNVEIGDSASIKLSGTISLPEGETVPTEGLDIEVFAYPPQGGLNASTMVHLNTGETSAGYTLLVDQTVQGLIVGYRLDSKSGYLNGWYGQNGAITPNWGDAITLTPNSNDINLTLIKGVPVEGTIQLPNGQTLNQDIWVNIHAVNNKGGYGTSILLRANETSSNFTIYVSNDLNATYTFGYDINPQYGYVQEGYNKDATSMTSDYNAASRMTIDEVQASGLTLTLIQGEKISGSISLPQGETVPAEGLNIEVFAEPTQGGLYPSTLIHLNSGDTSVGYTLTTDPSVQGYIVEYRVYTNTSYLSGWYGQNGAITLNRDNAITLTPNSNDINLTLVKGVPVEGMIQLPNGQTLNQDIWVNVHASNNEGDYGTSILLRANETSANFTIYVPNDPNATYTFGYYINPQYGYVQEGYYKDATSMTSDYNVAHRMTIDEVKASGLTLTLIQGEKISGTISIPQGETVPAEGLNIGVFANSSQGGYGYTETLIHLNPGDISVGYTLTTDPTVQGYIVGYRIYTNTSYLNGWYGQNGTTTLNQADAITLTPNSNDINLTLIKGVAIDGIIQLPNGQILNQDVWVNVHAFNDEGSYGTSVLIRANETSANFTVVVPNDSKATYIFHYSIDPQSGYVWEGYYKDATSMTSDYNAANRMTIDEVKASGLTLTLIQGEKIRGAISLPQGEVVPAEGIDIEVFANSLQGGYGNTWTRVHLNPGDTSVEYALTTDSTVQSLVVGYRVDPKYGYLNGWYGQSGNMILDQADATAVTPNSNDINLTLIKGMVIDGTIQIPSDKTLDEDFWVRISAYGDIQTSVLIRANQTVANFKLLVPNDQNAMYTFSYSLDPRYGFVSQGFFMGTGETTSFYNSQCSLTLKEVEAVGLTFNLISGEKIGGTISLPQGEVVPVQGMDIRIDAIPANGGPIVSETWVHLNAGETFVKYSLTIDPSIQNVIEYWVDPKYGYINGWYGQNGVTTPHRAEAQILDLNSVDINITLIKGIEIKGTIQLPSDLVLKEDVTFYVSASNDRENYSTSVLVHSNETSTSFVLFLPDFSNDTYTFGYNTYQQVGLIQQGYYKSIGGMTSDYNNASRLTLDEVKTSGLNLVLIKGERITGTIELPQGEIIMSQGLEIHVFAIPSNGGYGGSETWVRLNPGEGSVGYQLTIDPSIPSYNVGFEVTSESDYIRTGWYGQNGVITGKQSNAELLSSNANDINITLVKGAVVNGTIKLPSGQSLNRDIWVNIYASSNEDKYWTNALIHANETSANFKLMIPEDSNLTYIFSYEIYPQDRLIPQGYFRSEEEMTLDVDTASKLTVDEAKISGIIMTLISDVAL